VLAAVMWLPGRRAEAVVVLSAGTASWLLAKAVKEVAERGRPQHALEAQVALRGPKEGGSGFPSGHAATSTALAVVLGVALGGWWAPVLVALAVLTWIGRIYVGVHLPLDIVGGAGLGVAVAGLTTLIADIV
jgi:undecaprenyl-diphosphatase